MPSTLSGTSDYSARSIFSEDFGFQRSFHRAVRLPDGLVMIVGGQQQQPPVASTGPVVFRVTGESYDGQGRRQVSYEWETLDDTLTIGQQGFGISTADNRTIVTGGYDGTPSGSITAWDVLTFGDHPLIDTLSSGTMPVARGLHAQGTLANKVIVCGGFTTWGTELATVHEFNLDTHAWTAKTSMKFARQEHQAAPAGNGLLIMGGRRPSISATTVLNTCEFWDGTTWKQMGPMRYARHAFAAVPLPNDRILVLGGIGYDPGSFGTTPAVLSSCEIWDFNTKLWSPLPSMAEARDYPAAAYVPSLNAVVVTGGRDRTTCEILDLATMTWRKSLAQLPMERYRSQAVYAGNTDLVILVGGSAMDGPDDNATANDYLFIPAAETLWTGGLNRVARVEYVPSSTTLVYKTPGYSGITTSGPFTDQAAYQFHAVPSDVPGPYSFDPASGIAVTGIRAKTKNKILAGHQYLILELDDAGDPEPAERFPDEPGWLVFAFGQSQQVWPVQYLGRVSTTELSLDASLSFPDDLAAGTEIHLASQRAPLTPTEPVAGFYATASSAGRVAASDAVDDTVAAGIANHKTVVYPGDRGLGNEGFPSTGATKLTDAIRVWGSNDLVTDVQKAQDGE
jgi:hypothetical protein